jgi:tetratricopeptide (TPR) repeat protein
MERYEESLADLNLAIELDDKYASAIANRGETYRLMERYEEALADFTRAIELDEKYAWAIANRGVTYRLMERYEEALADSVRAVELHAEETTGHLSIIACYRKLGRMEDYQRQIQIARGIVEKDSVYNRACFAAVCGDTENALALLRRALEGNDVTTERAMMDPDFDLVREDPRFTTLLDEIASLLN